MTTLERHATDGELLAVHDGEADADLARVKAHTSACAACQARLDVIADRAKRVHVSLAALPVPSVDATEFLERVGAARARRRRPMWRRPAVQAAAAVVVLAVAAAASPVGHWVRIRIAPPASSPASSSNKRATAPIGLAGTAVSFEAASDEFVLRVDSVPAAGVVTLERGARNDIAARVVSGAGTGGDDFLVLPSELRVRNRSTARATYAIAVPSSVTRVRAIVAGRVVFDGAPPATIELSR